MKRIWPVIVCCLIGQGCGSGVSTTAAGNVDLSGSWTGTVPATASHAATGFTMTLHTTNGDFEGVTSTTASDGTGAVYSATTALSVGTDSVFVVMSGSIDGPVLSYSGHATGNVIRGRVTGGAFRSDSLTLQR